MSHKIVNFHYVGSRPSEPSFEADEYEFQIDPPLPLSACEQFEKLMDEEMLNHKFASADQLRDVLQSFLNRLSQ